MEPSVILRKQSERKQNATPPQRPNSPVPTKVNHLNVQAVSGVRARNCDMRKLFPFVFNGWDGGCETSINWSFAMFR